MKKVHTLNKHGEKWWEGTKCCCWKSGLYPISSVSLYLFSMLFFLMRWLPCRSLNFCSYFCKIAFLSDKKCVAHSESWDCKWRSNFTACILWASWHECFRHCNFWKSSVLNSWTLQAYHIIRKGQLVSLNNRDTMSLIAAFVMPFVSQLNKQGQFSTILQLIK